MRKSCYILDISEVLPSASFWTGCGRIRSAQERCGSYWAGAPQSLPCSSSRPCIGLCCRPEVPALDLQYRIHTVQCSALYTPSAFRQVTDAVPRGAAFMFRYPFALF